MKNFRYDISGKCYKGNVHTHSTASDGGMTFKEIAELYASEGYQFMFRTDHWVASDVASDNEKYPLLWIDGIEIDGADNAGGSYHTLCLGKVKDIRREDGYLTAMQAARQQGALIVLAHPHWCGNTFEDCLRWGFDGVEIYNHVCHWLNGKSNALPHWDSMLRKNPNVLALAVDDCHLRPEHPGWNGGWIQVNANECSANAILQSIKAGNFYSSCGPEIHSLSFDGNELHVETSPIKFARVVGPEWRGIRAGSFGDELLTDLKFQIPDDWAYAYLEIEDGNGRRAWTNNLWEIS